MPDENVLLSRNIHVPKVCTKCGGTDIEYRGVGEYRCVDCRNLMYDDFGVVRNYLEEHRGATASEVSHATGVTQDTIRQFLRDERLEIMAGSGVFMSCEICKAPIRSGKYCEQCARKVSMMQEAEKKANARKSNMQGFGKATTGESGAKRFTR